MSNSKKKTISRRWWDWSEQDRIWSWLAAVSFLLAMIGLFIHWVGFGVFRTIGLWMLIGFDSVVLLITFFRAKKFPTVWWWFWFFTHITISVVCFEIASYFFGG